MKKKKVSKAIGKKILKKGQTVVTIPDYHAPSILNDENRFFMNKMRKSSK